VIGITHLRDCANFACPPLSRGIIKIAYSGVNGPLPKADTSLHEDPTTFFSDRRHAVFPRFALQA
jgi:hypothetical protein